MVSQLEKEADVLIVGGSLGGVAAALASARMGMQVILTEETKWLGGQATTQGVPLDEHPWIEQYGCTQSYRDFREAIREYYRQHYPLTAAARANLHFNPGAGWVTALAFEPRVGCAVIEQMLAPYRSSGHLTTLMQHSPVAAETDKDTIVSVTVHDKVKGNEKILHAPYILDATELGDLLELADVEHVVGAESREETGEPSAIEGPSEPLRQQGFTHLAAVDYRPGENHIIEKPETYNNWRKRFHSMVGISDEADRMNRLFSSSMLASDGTIIKSPDYDQCIWNFRRVLYRDNFAPDTFPSDITMLMNGNEYRKGPLAGVSEEKRKTNLHKARQLTLSLIYFLQTEIEPGYQGKPGFPGIQPRGDEFGTEDGLAQYPYIRESRRIKAEFTVKEQHFRRGVLGNEDGPVCFEDSVGVGGYRIDIHESAKNGKKSMTKALHGSSWPQQIPLGSLIPVRMDNLIPACKNIGSTHITNGCFRLHPTEWNIGESAGTLAAFCVIKDTVPRNVCDNKNKLKEFQRILRHYGIELEWPHMDYARSYCSHYDLKDIDWYWGESWRLKSIFLKK